MKTRSAATLLLTAGLFLTALPAAASAQATKAPQAAKQVELRPIAASPEMADQRDLAGTRAIDFTLTDTQGKQHKLSDYINDGKIVVLEWFNPQCPVVVGHYKKNTMTDLVAKYAKEDVVWLAINSGADRSGGAETNEKARQDWEMSYPVLLDADGAVGKSYGSKNTPAMYVIGKDGTIEYTGGIDNNPRGREANVVNYVEAAVDALLAGSTVETAHAQAYGCSVKYGR